MATFLDAFGVLQNFSALFTFLFIFVLMYAILAYTKLFGENQSISALLAVVIAILFTLSKTVVRMFEYSAPWFVMLVIFVLMLVFMFRFLGASEADIFGAVKGHTTTIVFVFAFVTIILVFSFGQVREDQVEANESVTSFPGKVGEILQHPKVLGVIAILFIAIWAVRLLAENT
ncbi:hypothetical protein ACFLZ7_02865 [Nanoarchaeota archaeon]